MGGLNHGYAKGGGSMILFFLFFFYFVCYERGRCVNMTDIFTC